MPPKRLKERQIPIAQRKTFTNYTHPVLTTIYSFNYSIYSILGEVN